MLWCAQRKPSPHPLSRPRPGLSVSPANPSLTQGLQEAQAAKEGALKREAAVDVALAEAAAQAGSSASGAADAAATAETVEADNELMGEFLSEIQQSEKRAASADPTQEIDRLLQRNFQWKNLNPFEVLQLPSNASEDDVKRQYKKVRACRSAAARAGCVAHVAMAAGAQLSMLIHPDKVSDPRAGEAFQGPPPPALLACCAGLQWRHGACPFAPRPQHASRKCAPRVLPP